MTAAEEYWLLNRRDLPQWLCRHYRPCSWRQEISPRQRQASVCPFRPVARIRLFVWQEPLALHARKQAEQIGYRIFQSYPMRHPKQMQALEWSQDQKMFAGE